MLIETLLKPRHKPERRVVCFGKEYVFLPLPGHPSRFVADVADEQAATAFIATGAYTEFTDKLPQATLSTTTVPATPLTPVVPDTPPAAPPAPDSDEPDTSADEVAETTSEADAGADAATDAKDGTRDAAATVDRAKSLLSGAARAIRATVEKGPTEDVPVEVLKAALAIEQAESNPRPSVVIALEKAIKG